MVEDLTKKLAQRKAIKAKKPTFTRQEIHKNKKLEVKWRRPKGIQSKMRLNKNGKKRSVAHGFGSPKEVKGMSGEGLVPIVIHTVSDLKDLDPKTQGIIIGSSVGNRKKLVLMEEAKKLSLKILNVKDIDSLSSKIKEGVKARKENRKKKKSSKEEQKKKAEKAKEKVKKAEKPKISEEEKKDLEKKEKDDVLIHNE